MAPSVNQVRHIQQFLSPEKSLFVAPPPLQVVAGVVAVSPPEEGVVGSEEEVGGALEVEEVGGALEEDVVVVEGAGASEDDIKPFVKTIMTNHLSASGYYQLCCFTLFFAYGVITTAHIQG